MEGLLKRRKELLQAKQEIEKKLKLANSNKKYVNTVNINLEIEESKSESKITNTEVNKDVIINVNRQNQNAQSITKDMFWDDGRLVVLMDDKLIFKSFKNENGFNFNDGDFKKSVLALPVPFDQDATLLMDQGLLALSTASGNYFYHQNQWTIIKSFPSQNYKLHKILKYKGDIGPCCCRLIFVLSQKIFCIADWSGEKLETVWQVSDVETVIKTKGSINVLLVTSGSLILCHPITLEQVHFTNNPTNNTKSLYIDPNQICYFNYGTDATLFLVLVDKLIGRLKIIVGCADSGFSEIESIPIPKDYLWFKVQNPLIIYQNSKCTIHVLSLFTLEEEYKFDLEHEIHSFVMINSKILLFYTFNNEFLYIKLDKK